MPTSAQINRAEALIIGVSFQADRLAVEFSDGRAVALPLAWYPRLLSGTRAQREHWEFIGGGEGIHWPDLDEDLSAEGLLRGAPSPEFGRAAQGAN